MTAVQRWTIDDGDDIWTLAYNPTTMASPYAPKDMLVSTNDMQTVMQPSKAAQWSFSGNLYTDSEYTKLVNLHEKDQTLLITDHLLRVWKVVSVNLDITDRRNSRRNAERYTYTWNVLILEEIEGG